MIDWILFIIFIITQVLDIVTTREAITSGKGHEANPIAKWFIDKFGLVQGLSILKVPGVALMGVATFYFGTTLWWPIVVGVICAVMGYVIYNNYKIAHQ